MRFVDPILAFISDSEWCGRFREELELDRSFRGWMRAFRGMVMGVAGRVALLGFGTGLIVLIVVLFVLRGSE